MTPVIPPVLIHLKQRPPSATAIAFFILRSSAPQPVVTLPWSTLPPALTAAGSTLQKLSQLLERAEAFLALAARAIGEN